MYRLLISAHAVTATVALVAAFRSTHRRWFAAYYGCLVAMVVFLTAAVLVDFGRQDAVRNVVRIALIVLGIVMVARADAARRARHDGPALREHIGFTVVGLIDGFVVVAVIQAGASAAIAAALGVAIALLGHLLIDTAKQPAADDRPPPSTAGRQRPHC